MEVARSLVRAVTNAHLLASFRTAALLQRDARADALKSRLPSEEELRISYRSDDRASHRLLVLLYMYRYSGGNTSGSGSVHLHYGFLGMSEREMRETLVELTEQRYVSGRENDLDLTRAGIAAAERVLSNTSQQSDGLPALEGVLTSLAL